MRKLLVAFIALAAISLTAQDVYRLNDSTFVYPCIASDTTTSFNFVGLPLETGWTMASDFDPDGTYIDAISRWNSEFQEWETACFDSALGWCKDFPVEKGGAYLISAKNDFDFSVVGDSVDVVYEVFFQHNSLILPLEKSEHTLVSDFARDYGMFTYCHAVSKWLQDQQVWYQAAEGLFGWVNLYNVEVGMPLLAHSSNSEIYTWPYNKSGSDIFSSTSSNTTKGLNGGGPRIVFCHLVEGSDRELTADEMKLIQFEAFITERPTEILDENSYDCGFMHINGMSVLYVNLGNYPTPWSAGEQLNINSVNFSPMQGFMINLDIDNSSSAIFYGFEDQIPGSGTPWPVNIDAVIPLTGVDVSVREESGNIVLEWGFAGEDVTGYNIYESDDPYGTFSYVTTTTSLSWSTPASENKKFFYVASTNAKSSEPPKTIEINEKR